MQTIYAQKEFSGPRNDNWITPSNALSRSELFISFFDVESITCPEIQAPL